MAQDKDTKAQASAKPAKGVSPATERPGAKWPESSGDPAKPAAAKRAAPAAKAAAKPASGKTVKVTQIGSPIARARRHSGGARHDRAHQAFVASRDAASLRTRLRRNWRSGIILGAGGRR
jgi:hypothetical protein